MTAVMASFALILTLSFSEHCRKSHPLNLILLFAFTAAEGILVGAVSAQARTEVVVLAFATTAGVSFALCMYAMRTKNDFTAYGGMLYATLITLVMASFFAIFLHTPLVRLVISTVGAILFSAYLVYDVQMLMGGEHQHKLSPDEYVMVSGLHHVGMHCSSAMVWLGSSKESIRCPAVFHKFACR